MFAGHMKGSRAMAGWIFGLVAVGGLWAQEGPSSPATPAAAPGPGRATVWAAHDPGATHLFVPDAAVVRRLVERGLQAFAGRGSTAEAWRTWVEPVDVVGFKVTSAPGPVSGTRHAVVQALVESLIAAGHAPSRIVIWDRRGTDLRRAGWYTVAQQLGVRCVAAEDAGWDPNPELAYDKPVLGRLVAGDLEFDRKSERDAGRKSFVSRLLTEDVTKVIPVAPVLSHSLAGVNGQLVSLALGSVDNTLRFAGSPELAAEAIPEICALDAIWLRLAFGVSDALVCQYRGEDTVRLHNATMLNELRFSRDPVALDALAMEDIRRARASVALLAGPDFKSEVVSNAELLELGVADLARITVERVSP